MSIFDTSLAVLIVGIILYSMYEFSANAQGPFAQKIATAYNYFWVGVALFLGAGYLMNNGKSASA